MSLESLLPTFGDLGNASLFILAIAVALFYFGKLISVVKAEPSEGVTFLLFHEES
jgi:hypothetical protein